MTGPGHGIDGAARPTSVRAFALQVLATRDLDTKLAAPAAGLRDDDLTPSELPARPSRPPNLVALEAGAKVPSLLGMPDPAQRARLLHGWFNHELQAVELFAWGLLLFVDAPAPFRRGLLELLSDEQRHARLYIERLASLGHEPGDFPVSGYLWNKRSAMDTPLRFVAAMCLVFENANLDHTVDAAAAARAAGDERTAAVLDVVHREERRHVAFGLRWLRRFAPEGVDLVSAWEAALEYPLRPALARGPVLHREPREAVGLGADWLAALEAAER